MDRSPSSINGILSFRIAGILAGGVLIPLLALAAVPGWWSQRGVLNPNVPANDYVLVNQGQLKISPKPPPRSWTRTCPVAPEILFIKWSAVGARPRCRLTILHPLILACLKT